MNMIGRSKLNSKTALPRSFRFESLLGNDAIFYHWWGSHSFVLISALGLIDDDLTVELDSDFSDLPMVEPRSCEGRTDRVKLALCIIRQF